MESAAACDRATLFHEDFHDCGGVSYIRALQYGTTGFGWNSSDWHGASVHLHKEAAAYTINVDLVGRLIATHGRKLVRHVQYEF